MKATTNRNLRGIAAPHAQTLSRETFTVRDLSRRAAEVLRAAEKRGSVAIRSRTGKSFILTAQREASAAPPELPDFEARRRLVCPRPFTRKETEAFNKWLRGE